MISPNSKRKTFSCSTSIILFNHKLGLFKFARISSVYRLKFTNNRYMTLKHLMFNNGVICIFSSVDYIYCPLCTINYLTNTIYENIYDKKEGLNPLLNPLWFRNRSLHISITVYFSIMSIMSILVENQISLH